MIIQIEVEVEVPNSDQVGEITDVWDLVTLFYPEYDHSDEIGSEGNLQKLVDDEYEKGDCAWDLLQDEYDGDIKNPRILIDYQAAQADIYERTLESFINNIKSIKSL